MKLLRIAVPGLTWLLAIAGAWVYWRRRRDLVPIFLAAVPMAFAAVQSYGGELFLRIVLYGLPVLTILGADALRAYVRAAAGGREKLLAVGMLVLFPVLVLIRGGNEAYMVVTPEDITMTRAAFAETPPGSKIVPLDDTGPYAMQGVGVYEREGEIATCKDSAKKVASDFTRCILDDEPDVLLVYTSTEKQGRRAGQPAAGVVAAGRRRAGRVGGVPRPVPERVQRGAGEDRADGGQRAAGGGERWQLSLRPPAGPDGGG